MSYSRNRCASTDRLSKHALLAFLNEPSAKSQFDLSINPSRNLRSMLEEIPDDEWRIISFDAKTRIACVEINNKSAKVYLNIVIPYPSH